MTELDEIVHELIERHGIPGAVVGVLEDGRVETGAFGVVPDDAAAYIAYANGGGASMSLHRELAEAILEKRFGLPPPVGDDGNRHPRFLFVLDHLIRREEPSPEIVRLGPAGRLNTRRPPNR